MNTVLIILAIVIVFIVVSKFNNRESRRLTLIRRYP